MSKKNYFVVEKKVGNYVGMNIPKFGLASDLQWKALNPVIPTQLSCIALTSKQKPQVR